jgi:hypothetical protein
MTIATINSLRAMFIALYGLSLIPVLFVGGAALSDFGFRGCREFEAVQCSDARTVMSIILLYLLICPIFWIGTGVWRKRIGARGGDQNA